jgi:uncharacterized protein (DUF433 family)/DNA-binding transcriptional MerR regulator
VRIFARDMMHALPSEPRVESTAPGRRLSAEESEVVLESLARPVGRYDSDRASQLSGIPRRTVNYWFQHELLVPDDPTARRWSYRDLVFLRVFAWLRTKRMPPDAAAARVRQLKRALLDEEGITRVRSQGHVLLLGDESIDRMSGEMVFSQVAPFFSHLNLVALAGGADLQPGRLQGPDLLRPRPRITIRPSVLSGEPCIRGTRISTSAIYALSQERELEPLQIVRLYPGTTRADISQAIELEESLGRAA